MCTLVREVTQQLFCLFLIIFFFTIISHSKTSQWPCRFIFTLWTLTDKMAAARIKPLTFLLRVNLSEHKGGKSPDHFFYLFFFLKTGRNHWENSTFPLIDAVSVVWGIFYQTGVSRSRLSSLRHSSAHGIKPMTLQLREFSNQAVVQ